MDAAGQGMLEDVMDAKEFPVHEVTEEQPQTPVEELSHEERLAKLRKTVKRQPLHREILYRTLCEARSMKMLSELEEFIGGLPGFQKATQPQYYLIQFLVSSGGLAEYELAGDGHVIQEAEKEGLDEDGIDDLVATWAYETTEIGLEVVDEMTPSKRAMELIDEFAGWEDAVVSTIAFLVEKHTISEINAFFSTLSVSPEADPHFQFGAMIDRLEKAGMVAWDKGWQTTREGRDFLKTRQA